MSFTRKPLLLIIAFCVSVVFAKFLVTDGFAAPPPDPYADAVGPGSSALILNPANAVGAPDGNLVTMVAILENPLVLDMGDGEEGTGDLIVYYGGLAAALAPTVE